MRAGKEKWKSESVSHSVMSDSVTPWTVACQALLFLELSRQEYWGELQGPSPGPANPPNSSFYQQKWGIESQQVQGHAQGVDLTEDRAWGRVQVCWNVHIRISRPALNQSYHLNGDEDCLEGRFLKHLLPIPLFRFSIWQILYDFDGQHVYSFPGI